MIDDIIKSSEQRMQKAVEHLRGELTGIRTGRASAALLDHVRVDYYGTPTPVNGVANISVPDARMVVIQPWEKSMLGVIEKAIQKSDLGINPTNDGSVLRLVMPQLNEERRRELVKQVHQRTEEGRVAVRNVRRDGMEQMKKLEGTAEGDLKRGQERLEKLTHQVIQQIDEVSRKKETEVLEV